MSAVIRGIQWSVMPQLSKATCEPFQSGHVARDAVTKSIARHRRKCAKRQTLNVETVRPEREQLMAMDRETFSKNRQTVSIESFLADVFAFPTVAKRAAQLQEWAARKAEKRRAKRRKKTSGPLSCFGDAKTGTPNDKTKKRKPLADHSIGKTANLVRHGFDDARQNAYLAGVLKYGMSNDETLQAIDDETHPKHRLLWACGWNAHKNAVVFTQKREATFATAIQTLTNIAATKTVQRNANIPYSALRMLCKSVKRNERLTVYLSMLGMKQATIAERLGVSRDVVKRRISAARVAFNRVGFDRCQDILRPETNTSISTPSTQEETMYIIMVHRMLHYRLDTSSVLVKGCDLMKTVAEYETQSDVVEVSAWRQGEYETDGDIVRRMRDFNGTWKNYSDM